jgi:glycerol kinase
MILGLDVSTSITGATIIDENGKVIYNEAWDLRKYKDFFEKAAVVKGKIWELDDTFLIKEIYIEQSLQSFRSGFSSAKTLSTLSRFNGVVSWLCYNILEIKPEYIAATSARKKCGITIPKGTKAKKVVIKYVVDNVPDVLIEYTKHGNPKPQCFDMADSWVIAQAGWLDCQKKENLKS